MPKLGWPYLAVNVVQLEEPERKASDAGNRWPSQGAEVLVRIVAEVEARTGERRMAGPWAFLDGLPGKPRTRNPRRLHLSLRKT